MRRIASIYYAKFFSYGLPFEKLTVVHFIYVCLMSIMKYKRPSTSMQVSFGATYIR